MNTPEQMREEFHKWFQSSIAVYEGGIANYWIEIIKQREEELVRGILGTFPIAPDDSADYMIASEEIREDVKRFAKEKGINI